MMLPINVEDMGRRSLARGQSGVPEARAVESAGMTTLFTKIIAGELPGRFVWADAQAVAFTTIAPITSGHTLVVPRSEISEFTDAPDELLASLTRIAKIIGNAQKRAWQAPRAALIIAGFEVPHLHLHVLPAWGEANLSFAHAKHDVPADELDADSEKVREALREDGHGQFVPEDRTRV